MGLTRSAVRVLWLHLLEDVGWTPPKMGILGAGLL